MDKRMSLLATMLIGRTLTLTILVTSIDMLNEVEILRTSAPRSLASMFTLSIH